MATISTIPGKLDTRQSTGEVSAEQRERWEAAQANLARWRGDPNLLNPQWRREQAQRDEEAAEAARKAKGDPRSILETAINARSAAEREVARLDEILSRAQEHLVGIDAQRSELIAAEAAAATEAVADLVASFTDNTAITAASVPSQAATLHRLRAEHALALAARDRVQNDLGEAQGRAAKAGRLVRLATIDVAIDHAVEMAGEILALDQELRERRHALERLTFAVADAGRPHSARPHFPAIVSRALARLDEKLHGLKALRTPPDWRAWLEALSRDVTASTK
jgi:hypothetical protein